VARKPDRPETFAEARARHQDRVDECWNALRKALFEPGLTNDLWKPYTDAREKFEDAIKALFRFNGAWEEVP
jgi:hypothetical protein